MCRVIHLTHAARHLALPDRLLEHLRFLDFLRAPAALPTLRCPEARGAPSPTPPGLVRTAQPFRRAAWTPPIATRSVVTLPYGIPLECHPHRVNDRIHARRHPGCGTAARRYQSIIAHRGWVAGSADPRARAPSCINPSFLGHSAVGSHVSRIRPSHSQCMSAWAPTVPSCNTRSSTLRSIRIP